MTKKLIMKFFNKAKAASELSDFPKHHLGAVLVYKNKIVSIGFNQKKTNPLQYRYNKYRGYKSTKGDGAVHAEMAAMLSARDLDIDMSKASMFIYREHRNGKRALAQPCPACHKMLRDMGVKNIYFTDTTGWSKMEEYYESN